jgi:uncharacterized protein YjlB
VRFGEGGEIVGLTAGDVVVIPAGVGHARITEGEALLVVGAYAEGRDWDIVRDDPGQSPPPAGASQRRRCPAPTRSRGRRGR